MNTRKASKSPQKKKCTFNDLGLESSEVLLPEIQKQSKENVESTTTAETAKTAEPSLKDSIFSNNSRNLQVKWVIWIKTEFNLYVLYFNKDSIT